MCRYYHGTRAMVKSGQHEPTTDTLLPERVYSRRQLDGQTTGWPRRKARREVGRRRCGTCLDTRCRQLVITCPPPVTPHFKHAIAKVVHAKIENSVFELQVNHVIIHVTADIVRKSDFVLNRDNWKRAIRDSFG